MDHQGPIAGIAAAGRFVATAGYDNQLILWDAETRRPISRGMHDHLVNQCAFSSDATLIASASSDHSARIWDVPSLRLKAVLHGHEDDVDMAVFSPDDALIATCALDRKLRIFDTAGHCLATLSGHTGNILALAWSRDGTQLVSSSVDGTVREWDARSGDELRCNRIDVRTDTLEIDRNGRIIAGDDEGRIVIIIAGEMSFTRAHRAGVKKLAYDEAAGIAVTLSYDRTIAIWRLDGARGVAEISRATLPATVWARAAVLTGPSKVAVGTFGATFCTYDWVADAWDTKGVLAGPGLNAVQVLDERQYAIGDAGRLYCDAKPVADIGSLCNFLLAADGRLFTGGQLGQLFDARSGEILYQHHSPLNCAASFQRRGQRHIAVGTYTGEALIFAVQADGRLHLVEALEIYENAVKGLVASDELLFSVCASTDVAWHRIADLTEVRRVPHAHERIANGCCPAGAFGFASVGRDRTLRIWNGDAEAVYQTPHTNSVKCICASDDGNLLMTGAYTGTLAGFDMTTRSWVSFERPTASGISSLTFDSLQQRFLATSYDGKVYRVA